MARMADRRVAYRVLMGRPEGNNSQNLDVDGRITLKWTFKKWDGEAWTAVLWLRIGTVAGACECGNEPSSSIKFGQFLD